MQDLYVVNAAASGFGTRSIAIGSQRFGQRSTRKRHPTGRAWMDRESDAPRSRLLARHLRPPGEHGNAGVGSSQMSARGPLAELGTVAVAMRRQEARRS